MDQRLGGHIVAGYAREHHANGIGLSRRELRADRVVRGSGAEAGRDDPVVDEPEVEVRERQAEHDEHAYGGSRDQHRPPHDATGLSAPEPLTLPRPEPHPPRRSPMTAMSAGSTVTEASAAKTTTLIPA